MTQRHLRRERILALIASRPIRTQKELQEALAREYGMHVTQATLSRDIREMLLVKVALPDGGTRYQAPAAPAGEGLARWTRLFRESVRSLDASENLLVIKTIPAAAQAVAAAVDAMALPQVLATLGGDDTILVVVRTRRQVREVLRRLRELLRPAREEAGEER